jgi:hypothetical protein
MDDHKSFSLSDHISTKCSACHRKCSQAHIDGFFKMKRMKQPKSFREAPLKHFCNIDESFVNDLQQADLSNDGDNTTVMCSDLDGHATNFCAG